MKYTLVCDSETKNWPKNKNLYYLGFWCLEKINSSFNKIKELKIINCKERNDIETKEDIKIINNLYYDLLIDLSEFFNKFHKKNHSKKFWEIIVGPWLKVFLSIVYERFISIQKVLSNDEIEEIILVKHLKYDFSNDNVHDLEIKASKNINQWNTVLYTNIYEFLDKKKNIKKSKLQIIKNTENYEKSTTSIKNFIFSAINKLDFFNFNKEKFFIYNIDLRFRYLVYLLLSLKQFPRVYSQVEYQKKKIKIDLREKLNFKKKDVSKFETFVRDYLPFYLPTDLVENFQHISTIANKIDWPQNPKFIFTSLSYHADEIFKVYLANKIEKKSKYILHQHGSNYFTGKNTLVDYGFSSCDKFISWGEPEIKKCISLFNTKNFGIKFENLPIGKKILFFAPKMSAQRKRPWDDYGQMIRDNLTLEKILNKLNNDIKKNSIIKLHSNDYNSDILENKILNEIIFKRRKYQINRSILNKKLLKSCRIIVHSGDGTAFLETLSINIPTICILQNLNWIREDKREEYEELIKAKILFLDSFQATSHINKVYYDVNKWWLSKETKKIRDKFCHKYSKPPPNHGMRKMTTIFKEIINGK